jgi:methyl-accepting chemotaxis protein
LIRKKLGLKIALTVALSILLVEVGIGLLTITRQRGAQVAQDAAVFEKIVLALRADLTRSIQRERFAGLSDQLLEVCQGFGAEAFVLFDPEGKVLVQGSLKPGQEPSQAGLKALLSHLPKGKNFLTDRLKGPGPERPRFLAVLRDRGGVPVGGLSVEMPPAMADAGGRAAALRVLFLSLLTVLVVTGVIMSALYFLVAKPLESMKGELVSLSRGEADLTYQINVNSSDEIGDMARSFNLFIGRIRLMVTRVLEHSRRLTEQVQSMSHSTHEVSAMSEDVTTTVQQIARGAEEQAAKIAEVSQWMQEMQESMKEVEQKARETSGAVDKATATAKVGGKLAHGTIDKMVELNGIILKNSEMVGRLGARGKEIGRVVEIISGIAEQTNLLSLNAAIEAARAGEQGRGFAVVAEEIRALADGASRATQEITSLVAEMQDATSGVVESMEKGATEAQMSKESIRMMEGSLDEIISVVENVVQHTKSITALTGAQTQRYAKILHSIQDINAVSEESAASTEEVSASTQEQAASMEQVGATCKELAAMAEELKGMVGKFKIN